MPKVDLHINLLGLLKINRNGNSLAFPPSRKTRALLAYLVASGRPHSRKHLCDLFWEGPADPRASLRWSLSKIRSLINDEHTERLITQGNQISFSPKKAEIDYFRLTGLKDDDLRKMPIDDLKQAASLCQGTFLEDCNVPECYKFEAWLIARREVVARLQASILNTLVDRLKEQPEKALTHARQLLLLNPADEEAHIQLIKLLGEAGKTKEALKQYNRCRKIISEELNVKPSAALEHARKILIQAGNAGVSNRVVSSASDPPVVGRLKEQEIIDKIVRNSVRTPLNEVVLFSGEPGIGKTRMLKEIESRVIKSGGSVLSCSASYIDKKRPYACWRELFRSLNSSVIPLHVRKIIAPLLPDLNLSSPKNNDRNKLFNAVLELINILASDEHPFALLFDDLQWLDDSSLSLMDFITRETSSSVIIACAVRKAELQTNSGVMHFIHNHRKEKHLREIVLQGLSKYDTARLAQNVASNIDQNIIFKESKGNPLFVLEIAYSLREGNEILTGSLMNLISERLSLLNPQAKDLLNWIAVFEDEFTLDTLSKISDIPIQQILRSVEHLEQYNIIVPASAASYKFVHNCVRKAAYQNISEPRLKIIHCRIARCMTDSSTSDGQHLAEIVHHARLGDEKKLISPACLAAGRQALELFAYKEAAYFAGEGLNYLEEFQEEERISLTVNLFELYAHPGMIKLRNPDLMEQLRKVAGKARNAKLNALARKALYIIATIYYQRGDFHSALKRMIKAEEAGRSADPVTMVKAIADTAKCLGMIDREIERAKKLVVEARELAVEMNLDGKIYEVPMAMALVQHHYGRFDEAVALFKQAIEIIRKEKGHWWECYCMQRLPMIELERGRTAQALKYCNELLKATSKMGGGSEKPFAKALLALIYFSRGDDNATSKLDLALKELRRVDSRWMIAYIQAFAAEIDFNANRISSARLRANEALKAASLVNRNSEKTLAASVLIQIFTKQGKQKEAANQFKTLEKDIENPAILSARAQASLKKAADLLEG